MTDRYIYLDHAAATPLGTTAEDAMRPFLREQFFNPSSPYAPAVTVRAAYKKAKDTIARQIGVRSDELVMTAGATESINLAFQGVGGEVVVPSIEHHAVLESAKACDPIMIQPDKHGIIHPQTVQDALTPRTRLVSVALANNELGTIQPLAAIAEVIDAERRRRQEAAESMPLLFHSDASQGAGQLDIIASRLGVDLLTLNAAKVYGPKQVGLLWVKPGVKLTPTLRGGGQEMGLRSGTENVAGVIGFAAALEKAQQARKTEVTRLGTLRDKLEAELTNAFDTAIVSGHPKKRLASHLHISFPGIDAERVLFLLENDGVLVATGSACAANYGTRSHVLAAIGLPDEVINGSLRISLGTLSNEDNIKEAARLIIKAIRTEQERTR